MINNEIQQAVLQIIEFAQTMKLTKFRFICNWSEYRYFKKKYKGYKIIIKALQKGTGRLIKNYCNSLVDGTDNFTKLVAAQQMSQVINFYAKEAETFYNMICEYEAYLTEGNFLSAFLGSPRLEKDLKDFRE